MTNPYDEMHKEFFKTPRNVIHCGICGTYEDGYGHNPSPLCDNALVYGTKDAQTREVRVCATCNDLVVIPVRIALKLRRPVDVNEPIRTHQDG